ILFKEGPLTAEERSVMQNHPDMGVAMLTGIDYLEPAAAEVRYHHERWDGGGYPAGLRTEPIPLLARIFSVVDVWDALTHDRPYRPAWSEDNGFQHLRRGAGSMFDPP
ncbi:MAG TPA: HD domain-containing phosphohydrolase, partial [Longimicrobiales bacterium]